MTENRWAEFQSYTSTMSRSGQSTLWSLAERKEDGGENEEAGMGEWREGALDEGGA